MEKLQYQVLKKATGAVQGSSMEKVNKIAGVEDVETIMRANQARFIARCMADPAGVGDILQGKEEGRDWRDKDIRWMPQEHKGKDGFTLVAYRMQSGGGRGIIMGWHVP